jgi:transposase
VDGPTASRATVGLSYRQQRTVLMQLKRLAMDISKHVFTLHGVDEYERPLVRRNLKRAEVESFFAQLPGTEVVMEACGGVHHWGRLLTRLGHTVHLIPAQYVKPFVKRAKNDRADAEAISEAASRPGMASVPVKSAERQAELIILRHREMLLGQRAQAINALRGHATEFGVIAAKGTAHVQPLLDRLAEDTTIPAIARAMFARMGAQIAGLDRQMLTWMPSCWPSTRPTQSANCWPRCRASGRSPPSPWPLASIFRRSPPEGTSQPDWD